VILVPSWHDEYVEQLFAASALGVPVQWSVRDHSAPFFKTQTEEMVMGKLSCFETNNRGAHEGRRVLCLSTVGKSPCTVMKRSSLKAVASRESC